VRKTKGHQRQTLTALLREKGVKDINVMELTALVDFNRGTFYCHYRDIYDMLEQIEDEMFEEFRAVMNAYPPSALRVGLQPILRDVFKFINKNADMCEVLLGMDGDSSFFQRLKAAVYDRTLEEWGTLYDLKTAPNRECTMGFLVGGTVSMLQVWAKSGRLESPDEMAELAAQLIVFGIKPLER